MDDHRTTAPNHPILAMLGVALVTVAFLVTLGLIVYYNQVAIRNEQRRAQANIPDLLQALRADEADRLNVYKLDPATGKVQIPIDRSMELEAQTPWRPITPRPTPTPTPAPTPVPTPGR